MIAFLDNPPRIQPYFGYRNAHRLTIEARALRNAKPEWKHSRRLSKMRALLSSFASREHPRLPVTLTARSPDGRTVSSQGETNDEGFVRFDIELDDWAAPEHTEWETVELSWITRKGPQRIEGYVLAPGTRATLAVISDIDDTIIESGAAGGAKAIAKNWRRFIAEMPDERVPVPGADKLYGALSGGAVPGPGEHFPATHHPFFYVSSSPWNLFSYLVAFMKARDLPVGPIHLRDWGLNRDTLGSSSHGEHKLAQIESIIGFYPSMRFALIGDDTQADLVAFSKVAENHPDRVAAIFIRKAGEEFSPDEIAAKERIAQSAVPFWMGESYEIGQAFLEKIGLDHDGEAENIVETVDEAHNPDPA